MDSDDHRPAGPVAPAAAVLVSSRASSTTDADAVPVLDDGSVIDGFPSLIVVTDALLQRCRSVEDRQWLAAALLALS